MWKIHSLPVENHFWSLPVRWEYPDYWKKVNIVPVHKKESKNLVKNYRPISLPQIFGKIFERVMIFKNLFNYFH